MKYEIEVKAINPKAAKDTSESNSLDRTRRSYTLKNSTIKKLEELKIYKYSVKTSLEQIVEEAILALYESKMQGK